MVRKDEIKLEMFNPLDPIKILCYKDRIETIMNDHFPKPVTLGLDISNFCDDSCIWCLYKQYKKHHLYNMPFSLIKKAIEGARDLGISGICFSGGGEPLMNENFTSAVLLCAKNRIATSLNTNGSRLDFLGDEILSRLTYIRVSLDAGTEKTHNKLHKPSKIKFNQRIKMIEKICKKKLTNVGIGFLVHSLNYKEIYHLAKVLNSINCAYLQVRPLKNFLLSDKEKKMVFSLVEQARNGVKMPIFHSFGKMAETIDGKRLFKRCYMRYLVPNIGPDGFVYACCELRGIKAIGNIMEKRLIDIWGSNRHREVLQYLDKNTNICPACKYAKANEIIEGAIVGNLMHREFL